MPVKQGFVANLIRTAGFVRKELRSVLRQPRLILSLVVGPFLILLIFGFGYTEKTDPFRTLLVLESDDAGLATDIEGLGDAFGSSIDLVGTTTDPADGFDRLERKEVDLLIIAPTDALETIEGGEQAEFSVIHEEVDPITRQSIGLLATLSVDEVNRQVLAAIVAEAQEGSVAVEAPASGLTATAASLVEALESGDDQSARAVRAELEEQLTSIEGSTSDALLGRVAETLGVAAGGLIGEALLDLDSTDPDNADALESARSVETRLIEFESQLDQAQEIDPQLLVSPFDVSVKTLSAFPSEPAVFYSPGVLMLLVQHLAVTFAALSLVRERQLGVTEVFRVSPLSISEFLTGKYIAFVLIVGTVSLALTGLMFAFGVAIGGAGWLYPITVMLVLLASLGLGFVISAASQTDSQAIQYAMLVLLVSIFFTGFIIPLDRLLPPVQVVSFLLPATFGITAVQDIVFRGAVPDPEILAGLAGYVVVMSVLAWFFARKDVMSAAD
ncbi:MAG: ABC transporter permease [Acidimicrobiia bacterium]